MCLNKVTVRDLFHIGHQDSFFPCGRCVPCRQLLANKRTQKIKSHAQDNSICYFVTLSYDNNSIPYVLRSDIFKYCSRFTPSSDDPCPIPVYRNCKISRSFGSSFILKGKTNIGFIPLSDVSLLRDLKFYSPINSAIRGVLGLRTKINSSKFLYDSDRFSVAFTPDFQKFIKRFRENINFFYKQKVPFSFFYAPEYGPTTHRFHIHLLLWVPDFVSFERFKSLLSKSWPWCSRNRLLDFVEVARDPASYVSSYVNCPADLPKSLLQFAPLRCSHSLSFGFNKGLFDPEKIYSAFKYKRSVSYDQNVIDRQGRFSLQTFVYPKYVLSKFFPKIKGFSRLSLSTLRSVYLYPEQYLPTKSSVVVGYTSSGLLLYQSNIVDVYGSSLSFTLSEAKYFINRLNFLRYNLLPSFCNLSLSFFDLVDLIISFYTSYYSYIYLNCFNSSFGNVMLYFNLNHVVDKLIRAPTIDVSSSIDYSYLPFESFTDSKHCDTFYKHLKHRKLNLL